MVISSIYPKTPLHQIVKSSNISSSSSSFPPSPRLPPLPSSSLPSTSVEDLYLIILNLVVIFFI
jgi:hypothetical protein